MADYTDNTDLITKRANILSFGIIDFDAQHAEASRIIDRDMRIWYETEAGNYGIDPAGVSFDQTLLLLCDLEVKPAAILLALSLIYDYLAKDVPKEQDGFAAQAIYYREQFESEWIAAKVAGFSYDWDKSASISDSEKPKTKYRTLVRG